MSIIPRSLLNFSLAALLSFSGVVAFGLVNLAFPASAMAQEDGIKLWDETFPKGQWRSFGQGVLDSRTVEGGNGLSIDVDWGAATFGAGAVFEKGESGGMALPSLAGVRTISLEVRCTGDEARTVTLECVIRSTGKAYRASVEATKPVEGEWATYEFSLPDDFPQLASVITEIDALRVLFPKNESGGRGRVEFRNVRLLP